MSKNPKESLKIVNIEGENLLNDLRIFNEVFRKHLPYDNIKSHGKPRFYLLSRKHIFGKGIGRGV